LKLHGGHISISRRELKDAESMTNTPMPCVVGGCRLFYVEPLV
jgi:hypothetical protein